MYKYVLFDFDGTIADTSEGILTSLKRTFDSIEYKYNDINDYRFLIGPPLYNAFHDCLHFDEKNALEAVKIFRQNYNNDGLLLCNLYPGIKDLLIELNKKGINCYIASSKPTIYLEKLLDNMGIHNLFVSIQGSDIDNNKLTKLEIINKVLKLIKTDNRNCIVMIGDKNSDILSAKEANIKSIGVTYGFGTKEEIENSDPDNIANSAEEIYNYIVSI